MSIFRLVKLSNKLPHLFRSAAQQKHIRVPVAYFSNGGHNGNKDGMENILREILSDDDEQTPTNNENSTSDEPSQGNFDEEDYSESKEGRRKFNQSLIKPFSGRMEPEFEIHRIEEEVDRQLELINDDESDDLDPNVEYYTEDEFEDSELNLDDDDEFGDDDDDDSDDDEDDDEEDESEIGEPGRRGYQQEPEYLQRLDAARYMLKPSPEDAEAVKAAFRKMNGKKGDDLDFFLREIFWGSLKTEDGTYRMFAPNPAVKSLRIPKPRSLSQLQHSLEPKITCDPNSAGFQAALKGWNIVSRNLYYSERQKLEIANGLADKMNRLEQLVRNTEKEKIDVVFSDNFRRGLLYVKQKRGKNLRKKKRSQVIQRLKKA